MTDHVWGVDKSHYDPAAGTAELIAEGFSFLTHKAGGDSPDGELHQWWVDAKPHRAVRAGYSADGKPVLLDAAGRPGVLLGAYWVLYPGHGSAAGDSFIDHLDGQCPGWRDGWFVLQLDCERWGGDPGTVPDLSDIRACANRLRVLAPKLMPIVYAPHWVYGDSLRGLGFPLWSSSYVSARGAASAIYPGDSYPGWAPYSGITPAVAQFSSTATAAGDTTADVNCFRGTPAGLAALLAPGWEQDMTLTRDDVVTMMNTDNVIPAPAGSKNPDGSDNPYWSLGSYIRSTYSAAVSARTYSNTAMVAAQKAEDAMTALAAAVQAAGLPQAVDPVALATALAPVLAPLINHQDQADLETALRAAIEDVINGRQATSERAASDTPVHDEAADALTRAMRERRQPGIMSGQRLPDDES